MSDKKEDNKSISTSQQKEIVQSKPPTKPEIRTARLSQKFDSKTNGKKK